MSVESKENPELQLSVVLATYNRDETLKRTLACLADQTLAADRYEVIVIDDGSPDNTGQVVQDAIDDYPARLTYLHHENRGPGYTQNRGVLAANAPVVLLMADDVWLTPQALQAHLATHAEHPEPEVAVLGKVVQSPELFDQSVFMKHWDPYPFTFRDLEGVEGLHYSMFWVCNISAKKDFMIQHAMFREAVGRAGPSNHHDTEIGYRLHQHGLRILYNEAALGHHYHPYTLDQAIGRWYERGLNWGEFRRLVPDPEYVVHSHVLDWHTLPDYVRVLRGPNSLRGRERHLSWHLLRQMIRMIGFNRITSRWLWRPLMERAESNQTLAKYMSFRLYQAYLFQHFSRGVRDGRLRFGD